MKTLYKKNIKPYQNFTGFYKNGLEALNKLKNPQNKGKNQKVKNVNKLSQKPSNMSINSGLYLKTTFL